MYNAHVKIGDKICLVVEDTQLWCNILVEDIEYGDGTIWVKYLEDNK